MENEFGGMVSGSKRPNKAMFDDASRLNSGEESDRSLGTVAQKTLGEAVDEWPMLSERCPIPVVSASKGTEVVVTLLSNTGPRQRHNMRPRCVDKISRS